MGLNLVTTFAFACALALAAVYFPQGAQAQKFCLMGGPTDAPTLRKGNFIENYGTNLCLKQENYGLNLLQPVKLDSCTWNNQSPTKQHLFKIENHNGGSLVKPMLNSVFLSRCLVSPTGSLATNMCIPKSDQQTWVFSQADRTRNLYTIMKKSNRKCLAVVSPNRKENLVIETACSSRDKSQLWRICSSTV